MNEEEEKAICELKNYISRRKLKYTKLDRHDKSIDNLLNLIGKLQNELNISKMGSDYWCMKYAEFQKENEELKEKENKIYKEVQESLAFEKFLIVKERKPDLFNQGRFYISQIIYDILNDVQNPEGIHKENKCIQYIDYIPVQKVKDKIEEYKNMLKTCNKAKDKDRIKALNERILELQELLEKNKIK